MHDTAYRIGGLVIQSYSPRKKASILEIGAHNINGSLRDFATPSTRYVGMDFDAGHGVDIVLKPGEPWPVEDDDFDLVIASSVFEHDVAFWLTFLAMCRKAKPGGFIYVSAPSNGKVHRYPQDYWRFYPDAGLALECWAEREGIEITLVESFIAEREGDEWNDFCAVFRREPSSDVLSEEFVYARVPCTNVLTWKSSELLHVRETTQDQVLLGHEREKAARLNADVEWLQRSVDGERQSWEAQRLELETKVAAATTALADAEATRQLHIDLENALEETRNKLERERASRQEIATRRDEAERRLSELWAETEAREHLLSDVRNELRQRSEESSQAWAELADERHARQTLQNQVDDQQTQVDALSDKLQQESEWVFSLSQIRTSAERRISELERLIADQQREEQQLRRQLENALSKSQQHRQRAIEARDRTEQSIQSLKDEIEAVRRAATKVEAELRKALEAEQQEASERFRSVQSDMEDRFDEIAILTRALLDEERRREASNRQLAWFRDVSRTILGNGRWWWAFMPPSWRQAKTADRLAAQGLFDSESYLRNYPDVGASGQNPLRHYIFHGLEENRKF